MIIGSAASCIIALTWAGITYPWNSVHILAPLILGMVGLVGALLYEMFCSDNPSVRIHHSPEALLRGISQIPRTILSNRTTLSGYGPFISIYTRAKCLGQIRRLIYSWANHYERRM
jgi:hypothetical protein